jgi:hypothetical protein
MKPEFGSAGLELDGICKKNARNSSEMQKTGLRAKLAPIGQLR